MPPPLAASGILNPRPQTLNPPGRIIVVCKSARSRDCVCVAASTVSRHNAMAPLSDSHASHTTWFYSHACLTTWFNSHTNHTTLSGRHGYCTTLSHRHDWSTTWLDRHDCSPTLCHRHDCAPTLAYSSSWWVTRRPYMATLLSGRNAPVRPSVTWRPYMATLISGRNAPVRPQAEGLFSKSAHQHLKNMLRALSTAQQGESGRAGARGTRGSEQAMDNPEVEACFVHPGSSRSWALPGARLQPPADSS